MENELLELLDNENYYSLNEEYVRKKLKIISRQLRRMVKKIKDERGIQINMFRYNDT
jgi:hypothetical protein